MLLPLLLWNHTFRTAVLEEYTGLGVVLKIESVAGVWWVTERVAWHDATELGASRLYKSLSFLVSTEHLHVGLGRLVMMWSTLAAQRKMHGERRGPEMASTGKTWRFKKEKWLLLRLQWWDRMKIAEVFRPNLNFWRKIISGLVMDWLWEFRRESCQRRWSASCPMTLNGWSTAGGESCKELGWGGGRSQFQFWTAVSVLDNNFSF